MEPGIVGNVGFNARDEDKLLLSTDIGHVACVDVIKICHSPCPHQSDKSGHGEPGPRNEQIPH